MGVIRKRHASERIIDTRYLAVLIEAVVGKAVKYGPKSAEEAHAVVGSPRGLPGSSGGPATPCNMLIRRWFTSGRVSFGNIVRYSSGGD